MFYLLLIKMPQRMFMDVLIKVYISSYTVYIDCISKHIVTYAVIY